LAVKPYIALATTIEHRLFDLELEFGQAFSTFLYKKTDWSGKLAVTPFYENVEREGIRISLPQETKTH